MTSRSRPSRSCLIYVLAAVVTRSSALVPIAPLSPCHPRARRLFEGGSSGRCRKRLIVAHLHIHDHYENSSIPDRKEGGERRNGLLEIADSLMSDLTSSLPKMSDFAKDLLPDILPKILSNASRRRAKESEPASRDAEEALRLANELAAGRGLGDMTLPRSSAAATAERDPPSARGRPADPSTFGGNYAAADRSRGSTRRNARAPREGTKRRKGRYGADGSTTPADGAKLEEGSYANAADVKLATDYLGLQREWPVNRSGKNDPGRRNARNPSGEGGGYMNAADVKAATDAARPTKRSKSGDRGGRNAKERSEEGRWEQSTKNGWIDYGGVWKNAAGDPERSRKTDVEQDRGRHARRNGPATNALSREGKRHAEEPLFHPRPPSSRPFFRPRPPAPRPPADDDVASSLEGQIAQLKKEVAAARADVQKMAAAQNHRRKDMEGTIASLQTDIAFEQRAKEAALRSKSELEKDLGAKLEQLKRDLAAAQEIGAKALQEKEREVRDLVIESMQQIMDMEEARVQSADSAGTYLAAVDGESGNGVYARGYSSARRGNTQAGYWEREYDVRPDRRGHQVEMDEKSVGETYGETYSRRTIDIHGGIDDESYDGTAAQWQASTNSGSSRKIVITDSALDLARSLRLDVYEIFRHKQRRRDRGGAVDELDVRDYLDRRYERLFSALEREEEEGRRRRRPRTPPRGFRAPATPGSERSARGVRPPDREASDSAMENDRQAFYGEFEENEAYGRRRSQFHGRALNPEPQSRRSSLEQQQRVPRQREKTIDRWHDSGPRSSAISPISSVPLSQLILPSTLQKAGNKSSPKTRGSSIVHPTSSMPLSQLISNPTQSALDLHAKARQPYRERHPSDAASADETKGNAPKAFSFRDIPQSEFREPYPEYGAVYGEGEFSEQRRPDFAQDRAPHRMPSAIDSIPKEPNTDGDLRA